MLYIRLEDNKLMITVIGDKETSNGGPSVQKDIRVLGKVSVVIEKQK
jgi:hypothetical protein